MCPVNGSSCASAVIDAVVCGTDTVGSLTASSVETVSDVD